MVRTHFSDHAPNRNPCEPSFRMVDRRITEAQVETMNELDCHLGLDDYYVLDNGNVEINLVHVGYYATIKRDGIIMIEADKLLDN